MGELLLGHTKLGPINKGLVVPVILFYNKLFRDFDYWPLNRGWRLKRCPRKRGSTVILKSNNSKEPTESNRVRL